MGAGKRLPAAVICVAAALFSAVYLAPAGSGLAPASAAAVEVAPEAPDPLGQALMTAAKAAGVLDALEGSLVYLGAKYESATTAQKVAKQSAAPRDATFEEYASGKVPLPPASAGTNGTKVPPPPGSRDEPLVARIPATPNSYGDPTATYVSGIALSPAEAPERVAGAINGANTIVGRPYVWGGGHGSWYDRGYDCSGAVSFALAGGGFLSEPLTSGQFDCLGRARSRPLDHDLRESLPRLRSYRRPALGHGRRRPRQRPPLARRWRPPGRLRRPPPARLLNPRVCSEPSK